MTKREIRDYKASHPVYYPTLPPLKTQCPIKYDYNKCSSKECEMSCRTCVNYNPLRMLYERELKSGTLSFGVPIEVLLADAKTQLDH